MKELTSSVQVQWRPALIALVAAFGAMHVQGATTFTSLAGNVSSTAADGPQPSPTAFTGNATGELAFEPTYLDLLDPKPQGGTDQFGFRFAINVTADEPDRDDSQLDKSVTVTEVWLLPPKALGFNSSTSKRLAGWKACWLTLAAPNLQVGGDTVDENCTGIVPEKCLTALQNQVVGGGDACPQPSPPLECKDVFGPFTGANFPLDKPQTEQGSFNNDVLYGDHVLGKAYNHNKGYTTVYNRAIRQIIVGRLAYANEKLAANGTADIPRIPGAVKCVRADKFAPGSQTRSASIPIATASSMLALMVVTIASVCVLSL